MDIIYRLQTALEQMKEIRSTLDNKSQTKLSSIVKMKPNSSNKIRTIFIIKDIKYEKV